MQQKRKIKLFSYRLIAIILAALVMILLSQNFQAGKALSANFPVWVAPSLDRIAQNQNAGLESKIELLAARGEYESFQIGIKAPEAGLSNVNFSVSDLSGPNNSVIPKTNITLYRQHYVPVNNSSTREEGGGSNQPLGTQLYADALIPFVDPETNAQLAGNELDAVPFKLDAGKNQPIWVDVFVPRNAQPGQYTGTYNVTSDQGEFSGEISLKVWNFELPLKPSLKSSFLVWQKSNNNKSTFVELLKHKIMPGADIDPGIQRELIDRWGLNSLKLPFYSGTNYFNCNFEPAPSVEAIQAEKAKNQSDVFQFVYSVDEIDNCPNFTQPLKQWSESIKQANVKHLAVMTPVPEFYENNFLNGQPAVDVWVVLPKMYEAAFQKVSEALGKGAEVWSYTAISQDNYSPKWLLDYAPINFRIPHGFINQSLGMSGTFYWQVDNWKGNPWKDEQTVFQDNTYYPGEGLFVYPGQQVGVQGVVPSMRLKWLRDGVEDYEYVEILKKLGRQDLAMEITRSVASGWRNWTKDPKVLLEARQKLGEEIEKIK